MGYWLLRVASGSRHAGGNEGGAEGGGTGGGGEGGGGGRAGVGGGTGGSEGGEGEAGGSGGGDWHEPTPPLRVQAPSKRRSVLTGPAVRERYTPFGKRMTQKHQLVPTQ